MMSRFRLEVHVSGDLGLSKPAETPFTFLSLRLSAGDWQSWLVVGRGRNGMT